MLKLGGQLAQSCDGVHHLLNLAREVNDQLLLGGIGLVQSPGQLVHLLVNLHIRVLGHLAVLPNVGALPHGDVKLSSMLALVHLGLGLILVQAIYLNISSISEKQFTIAHRIPACASTVLVPSITLVEWNARFPEPKWFKSEHPDVSRGKVAALDVHNVA